MRNMIRHLYSEHRTVIFAIAHLCFLFSFVFPTVIFYLYIVFVSHIVIIQVFVLTEQRAIILAFVFVTKIAPVCMADSYPGFQLVTCTVTFTSHKVTLVCYSLLCLCDAVIKPSLHVLQHLASLLSFNHSLHSNNTCHNSQHQQNTVLLLTFFTSLHLSYAQTSNTVRQW